MLFVPLNIAPLHWRIAFEHELAPDITQRIPATRGEHTISESRLRRELYASLHNLSRNMGKLLEPVFWPETGEFVVKEKGSTSGIKIISGPFWAIGTKRIGRMPSILKETVYRGLLEDLGRAWILAAIGFVKAASLSKCVATGIKKNDPHSLRMNISPSAWRYEIREHTTPSHVQTPDGVSHEVSNHAALPGRYFVGPKIDWANNAFTSLDGEEWTDVQVIEAGALVSEATSSPPVMSVAAQSEPEGQQGTKLSPRKSYSESQAKEFYRQRVASWPIGKSSPTRDKDFHALRLAFPGIGRDKVREFRRDYAPTEWTTRGRRNQNKLAGK